MAHGWDSYFHNIPPLSSDPSTLRRTSESDVNLSQHIENFIGHHEFPNAVSSHEDPATNSNFNPNYFSNPSTGNSSSDCVYQRYYKETPWQADAVQMGKEFMPGCENSDMSDIANDGLTESGSFLSSFGTDLQGLKQDCGMLATSFPEGYSDVSSSSDADVGESRPSCKFMASNSVPKPKTTVTSKYSSPEWLFTQTENMAFPTESLCQEKSVNHDQSSSSSKMAITTSNIVTTTWGENINDNDGCQDQKQNNDVERDVTQGNNSNILISGHATLTGDEIEEYTEGMEEEQKTDTDPTTMTTFDYEQDFVDEKIRSEEMKQSIYQDKEGHDNTNATDGQDRDMSEDKHHKSGVLRRKRKESGDEQKFQNSSSTDCQNDILEKDFQEKEIMSNTSKSSDPPGIKVSDATSEAIECTNTLRRNGYDVASYLQLSEYKSCESEAQDYISGCPTTIRDCHSSNAPDKNDQSVASHSESCIQPGSSIIEADPQLGNDWISEEKETYTSTSSDPDSNDPGVTSDSLSINTSYNYTKSVSISKESCLHSNNSNTDINCCVEKELVSPAENTNTTSSLDQCQSLQQSSVPVESEGLVRNVAENARESFEELDISTEESSLLGVLYGEPLSREDSCDIDETNHYLSQSKNTFVAKPDSKSMNHSEGQAPQLKSSIHLRKHLQPVVILKTIESANGMSNSYHCADCHHTTQGVDHLIEHHYHCHSVQRFQFCKTCNLYLIRNQQAKKHLCGVITETPQLSSGSSLLNKRKRTGPHKCIKCNLKFSIRIKYIQHMRTHTGKTPYECKRCGLYFSQGGALKKHKLIPGRCKIPELPVTNADDVISETKLTPNKDLVQNKPYANLPECYVKLVDIAKTNLCIASGKDFLTAKKAKKQFYNMHKTESLAVWSGQHTTDVSRERSQKAENEMKVKYKCPLCPRLFKYIYNRARHLRDCVRDSICGGKGKVCGKFKCPLCYATFTLASNRYRHIKKNCLRDCLNQLAKDRVQSMQKVEQINAKETEQKTKSRGNERKPQSKENVPKKQAPQALEAPKKIPSYKCNHCPALFCHASGKYRHMKKHEMFKLTGKMFRYRNSVFSTTKPANSRSPKTEEAKDNLKAANTNGSLALGCHFCDKLFGTSQSLKKHERSHRGERPYICLECGKGFKKRGHLISHKIVHQRRIQCTVCKKICSTIGELIQHRSSHLKRGKLQCPDCHLQFQYPAYLLRHLDAHKKRENKGTQLEEGPPLKPQRPLESIKEQSGLKHLQCSLCKEVFDDAQVLRKHCLTHITGSSSNQCPFCKRKCNNRRHLLRHMIIHTGDKPFSCTDCGQQFYRDFNLKLHREKCLPPKTKLLATMESKAKTVGSHTCSYCPRVFTRKIRLRNHHRGHKKNSLLLCSRCQQYFGFTKLGLHEKKCKGAKERDTGLSSLGGNLSKGTAQTINQIPLQSNATRILKLKCPHCTERFRYRSILLRHLVSHTGVQPYACVHCGHRYGSQTRCLQHEASCNGVHKERQSKIKSDTPTRLLNISTLGDAAQKPQAEGENEYKCKFCTKTFMKSQNLRRHILTHNEVKPYRCKACESCFSRYDHLKVHQTRCKGKRTRLEICIPKISLDDVGKGWQNKFGVKSAEKQGTFDCKVCVRSFPTESKLSRHNTMYHITKLFKCTQCDSSFAHEKTLKAHKKRCSRKVSKATHSSPRLGTNPPTEKVTKPLNAARKQVLQRIQPYSNKKNKHVCSYCPRAFGNNWQLRVHNRLHTGERPYACDNCGQRFIRKDYVKRHIQKCHKNPQNKVLCDKKSGALKPSLSQSSACQSKQATSRSPPKGFSCAYCSSRFLLFSQLQEHFINAHKMETIVPPVSTAPLQHHLSNIPNIKEEPLDESCDEQLNGGVNLICKLDKALDGEILETFSCPECNMLFANKSGLTGHMRIHAVKPPFSCKTCKRGFWNKHLLRNHQRKCRLGHISDTKTVQHLEVPLKAEIDFALNDSVLLFKESSKRTGTGVLQTNFSCKEDLMDKSLQNAEGNQAQDSSSQEKKAVQYQCSECDKSFTDGLMLISHLEDHGRQEQDKKRNACSKCGRVCSSQVNLEKHMRMHGITKKCPCPNCPKMFYTLSDLEIHRTCHDPNRPFACKICDQRFWTRPSLSNHYTEDHLKDLFTCLFCKKAYSLKKSLARHYKKWHKKEQKDHGSTLQDKGFTEEKSSSQISTNGESDEDENNGSENTDSDSAPYFPCHVCGKTFPTSESLEDHQRCHLGEKPHECAECGKCFFQASQLQQHQRMHKSEFQCQACGRGFVSLFALRNHKHTHGKSRPYRCSKCHFSFPGPSQLAEHMSTHREENFPCDICSRVFLSKISRAEHRKSHSKSGFRHPSSVSMEEHEKSATLSDSSSTLIKEPKYRCGVCSERFRDPEELSEHGCVAAEERPYSCLDCKKHFLHASHLQKHKTTHRQSWSSCEYQCNQCNNSFSSSQHFLNHLSSHVDTTAELKCKSDSKEGGSSKRFICPVCHQCFAGASELIGHFPTHSEGKFECTTCKITFSSGNKLEEHKRRHLTSATEFECTDCGLTFLGRDTFRKHRCSSHQHAVMETEYSHPSDKKSPPNYYQAAAAEEEEIDVTGEDLYNCPVCSMQFFSKSGLLEHQNKQHQNEKPFKCELCGKTFAVRRYLREHVQRHRKKSTAQNTAQLEESNLRCTQCNAEFSAAEDLSVHMRLHAEKQVGEYRCDMCYKSFSQLSLLKQHQESHVGQVVYECTECDKAFAFPHLLEEHQKTHAGSFQ